VCLEDLGMLRRNGRPVSGLLHPHNARCGRRICQVVGWFFKGIFYRVGYGEVTSSRFVEEPDCAAT
jgi:hypothetical protein